MIPDLPELPGGLPQTALLRDAADRLAARPDVRAAWLGGSFAEGRADAYSDVDLRIAVDDPEAWRRPNFADLFRQPAVGAAMLDFGRGGFLHHLVLADGTLFDLFVCDNDATRVEPEALVVFSRDDGKLPTPGNPHPPLGSPDSAAVRQLLADYWMTSHKHRKPIARGMASMCAFGMHHERLALLRLWSIRHDGRDMTARPTIHAMTPACRSIEQHIGPDAMRLLGMPLRDRSELIEAVEATRDEVGAVGRELAQTLAFAYPDELEAVVRRAWRAFIDKEGS